MSIKVMNQVWDTPCKTHTQKIVLIALADNSNDQFVCWPSITNLALRCDLSRQGVMDQIEGLVQEGKLKVRKTDGKVNVYELFPNRSTPLTSQPEVPVHRVDRNPSTALTPPVYAVDPNHQEPPFEPPTPADAELSPAEKKKIAWRVKCLSSTFNSQWAIAYEKHHPGEKMQLTGPDKGQIKLFFQTATITPRQVVEVAVDVWKNGRRGFWCDKLHSPFILLSKWSDIRAEIKNGGRGLRPHSTILPPGAAASTGNL